MEIKKVWVYRKTTGDVENIEFTLVGSGDYPAIEFKDSVNIGVGDTLNFEFSYSFPY